MPQPELFVLEHDGSRELIFRPKSYIEAVQSTYEAFPLLEGCAVALGTNQLEICDGEVVRVSQAMWSLIASNKQLTKLVVIVDGTAPASTPAATTNPVENPPTPSPNHASGSRSASLVESPADAPPKLLRSASPPKRARPSSSDTSYKYHKTTAKAKATPFGRADSDDDNDENDTYSPKSQRVPSTGLKPVVKVEKTGGSSKNHFGFDDVIPNNYRYQDLMNAVATKGDIGQNAFKAHMDQYLLSRSGTGEPPHINPTLEHRARYADLVGEYVPILRSDPKHSDVLRLLMDVHINGHRLNLGAALFTLIYRRSNGIRETQRKASFGATLA